MNQRCAESRRTPGRAGRRRAAALGLALALPLLAASACADRKAPAEELPVLYTTPEFALVDQRGDTLRRGELRGQAWAVSFVFTHCRGVCPAITARMAVVRDSLRERGLLGEGARLVSVSTDPARDRPGVLRSYADRFGGSPPEHWAFLTGWPPERVHRLLEGGFHVTVSVPDSAPPPSAARSDTARGYQVGHSPRILVVDTAGRVRAAYSARSTSVTDSVLSALARLAPGTG